MRDKGKFTITKTQIACVAAGIILCAAGAVISSAQARAMSESTSLKRAGPGQGETIYEVEVSGLDKEQQKKISVKIPVRERTYSEEEADQVFKEARLLLEEQILGENNSLKEVRKDLNFKTSLGDYGIKLRWESENPDLVDTLGTVHNEKVNEEGEAVMVLARATSGVHEKIYKFNLRILPRVFTEEEKAADQFLALAGEEDIRQQTEDYLKLPESYSGQKLNYYFPSDNSYRIFPVLGIFMAALLYAKEGVKKRKGDKLREQQLLFDYSEVVSKLVVYIGAGLTVRSAFSRIASGYEGDGKKRRIRPAYEEIVRTVSQLGSGVSESKAFGDFGRRCALQPYLKLSTLLEQSQKNGSRQLRQVLELEMVSAFEQRKNLAKKLGEEAGTKLLIPLFLMLLVVMIMIIVPAFLSFY